MVTQLDVHGAALEAIQRRYGGPCREVQYIVTANDPPVLFVPRDPERITLTLTNLDINDCIVSPFQTVIATSGMRLGAGGGLISFTENEDGILPTLEWWVLCPGIANLVWALAVRRELMGVWKETVKT
jgi:hypothetical protein